MGGLASRLDIPAGGKAEAVSARSPSFKGSCHTGIIRSTTTPSFVPMSPGAFDRTLGGPLIATWLMSILLTLEGSQARTYFKNCSQDAVWRRAIVGVVLGFDVVTIVMSYTFMYLCQWQVFGAEALGKLKPCSFCI